MICILAERYSRKESLHARIEEKGMHHACRALQKRAEPFSASMPIRAAKPILHQAGIFAQ